MDTVWITTGSTTVEAMVNPLAAACNADGITESFVPDTVYFLDNPGLGSTLSDAKHLTKEILEGHGIDSPTIRTDDIDHETDFENIAAYFRAAVEDARAADADVAIDVTPGRKFMSVFAFNAGTTYEVDHLFYFYLHSNAYFGRIYQTIPRTAGELYDFTEVL
ncbi:CRISPR-associated ring nuclease [Halapricum desulfuricans]|uniref:CARF domain containing protein n=1 Tax=Halapricum desulfuricans TaxID=2841257 RepID=A0A897P275_9EURY|nr:CRISPR-associated ring nuclease [Halapricum desulfuricans]QSG16326.1 CARF domain containing protein [Halapricum desulfuricans]